MSNNLITLSQEERNIIISGKTPTMLRKQFIQALEQSRADDFDTLYKIAFNIFRSYNTLVEEQKAKKEQNQVQKQLQAK